MLNEVSKKSPGVGLGWGGMAALGRVTKWAGAGLRLGLAWGWGGAGGLGWGWAGGGCGVG